MSDNRPCTCHPDDKPPVPCERQYALTDCRTSRLARIAGLWEAVEILMDEGFVGESYRRILARIAELEKP